MQSCTQAIPVAPLPGGAQTNGIVQPVMSMQAVMHAFATQVSPEPAMQSVELPQES